MDDKDRDHPLTKFSADSSWLLGGDSDAPYFFQNYRDGATLTDFDWNLHAHTTDPTRIQIESDVSADTYLGIATSGADPPALPQPAVSSSSSEDPPEKSTVSAEKALSETASKVKKKGQKRIRQQRYAFVTKTDVDHLEDGYRWRKYGQKAVKNSPFPRSYYRCTNSKCTVKKRVERSYEDPTTVITTYEGQHCHHTVGFSRGGLISTHGSAFPSPLIHSPSQYYYPRAQFPQEGSLSITQSPQVSVNAGESHVQTEANPQTSLDEGLLGDMVPPGIRNR